MKAKKKELDDLTSKFNNERKENLRHLKNVKSMMFSNGQLLFEVLPDMISKLNIS